MQMLGLIQSLGRPKTKPLSYQEWLAATGRSQGASQNGQKTGAGAAKLSAPLAALLAKKFIPQLFAKGATSATPALASGAATSLSTATPALSTGITASAAPVPAAGLTGAGSTIGSALGTGAILASPIILGTILDRTLFKSKPKRVFNPEEIASDMSGKRSYLNEQVGGWKGASAEERSKFLNDIHNTVGGAGLIAMPGYADKEGNTQKRGAEFLNFARYLQDPNDRNNRMSKWYNGASAGLPTEEDINGANHLTNAKKDELRRALALAKGLGAAPTNTPEAVPMQRGGMPPVVSRQPLLTAAPATTPMLNRSQTRSPGIRLDGTLINYNRKK